MSLHCMIRIVTIPGTSQLKPLQSYIHPRSKLDTLGKTMIFAFAPEEVLSTKTSEKKINYIISP